MELLTIAFCLIILFLFLLLNALYYRHPQIPGPFTLPFLGGAHAFIGYTDAKLMLYRWQQLVEKYGGTMSLWLGGKLHVVITKPEHIQTYCTSPLLLDHAALYDFYKTALGDGLFTSNGSTWKARRKAWAPSFHPSILRHFIRTFQEQSEILVEVLEKEVGGPEFPLYHYLRNYSIDNTFANALDFKRNGQRDNDPLSELIEPLNEILFSRLFKPYAALDSLFYLTPDGRQFLKVMRKIKEYLIEVIEIKKKQYSEEDDLPEKNGDDDDGESFGLILVDDYRNSIFIRQLLHDPNLSSQQLIEEIMTIIVTGYETVTRALGFCILMLGKDEKVQQKVFLEDKEIQKRLDGRELQADDLLQYEYLESVIKETLRIFPVGPILGRTASKDMKIGPYQIPKGTNVLCLLISTHRNGDIYPNPLQFNPDNFLPENIEERHPYSYIPFSSGPRGCIGVKYGMMSMKIMLSTLVRKYKIINSKNVEDIKLKVEVTMRDADEYLIRLEKRS